MGNHLPRLYQRSVSLISQYWHGKISKAEFIKCSRCLEEKIHHEVEVKNNYQKQLEEESP